MKAAFEDGIAAKSELFSISVLNISISIFPERQLHWVSWVEIGFGNMLMPPGTGLYVQALPSMSYPSYSQDFVMGNQKVLKILTDTDRGKKGDVVQHLFQEKQ